MLPSPQSGDVVCQADRMDHQGPFLRALVQPTMRSPFWSPEFASGHALSLSTFNTEANGENEVVYTVTAV